MDLLGNFTLAPSDEELRVEWKGHLNNPVLYNLLRMGIFNWKRANVHRAAAILAMCFSTVLVTRLLPCILELEKKVLEESLNQEIL